MIWIVYMIGFGVTWAIAAVRDELNPQYCKGGFAVVFLGEVVLSALWPLTLPRVLGVTIAEIVKRIGKS